MAKLKFTAIVSDMRGKLAGSVFSKNRSGAYMRTKVTPVNPQSAGQSVIRSRLTGLTQNWRSLTADQRSQWSDAAPNFPRTNQFGDQVILTGQQLYIGLNANLINVGTTAITTPPSPGTTYSITSATLAMAKGAGTATVAFGPSPVPAGNAVIVEATPAMSPGKTFAKNLFRQISIVAAAGTTPINIAAAYTTKFGGIPAAGQKVFVRLTPVNTVSGQKGQGYISEVIVLA